MGDLLGDLTDNELREVLAEICVSMPHELCAHWQLVCSRWNVALEPLVATERLKMMRNFRYYKFTVNAIRRIAGAIAENLKNLKRKRDDAPGDLDHHLNYSYWDVDKMKAAYLVCVDAKKQGVGVTAAKVTRRARNVGRAYFVRLAENHYWRIPELSR